MRGHLRTGTLAIVPLALLLTAGCRSDAPPPADEAAAAAQPATEEAVAPAEPVSPADGGAVSTPVLPAADQPSAPRPSPTQAPQPAPPVRPSPTMGTPAAPAEAAAPPVSAPAEAEPTPAEARAPSTRFVELPSGTALPLELTTTVSSETSAIEDPVSARVTRDVEVDGETIIPEGARVAGRVTHAQDGGRVKGVAALTVRFYTLTVGSRTYDLAAEPVRRQAQSTKGKDAQKIGIGAGAGAVVGGLLGGRKGAAIGAAAGGAGGTGVVLATRGQQVHLPSGTAVTVRLTEPLAVTVR